MRRILIVDDSKVMQQLVGSLLSDTGAALDFASSASEALYSFQQNSPDLVVSDIEMPGMSGVELAERIRRESLGRTKVVLMSAGDMNGGRSAVKKGHADAFLPKPTTRRSGGACWSARWSPTRRSRWWAWPRTARRPCA